jgi:hypothetical protein
VEVAQVVDHLPRQLGGRERKRRKGKEGGRVRNRSKQVP